MTYSNFTFAKLKNQYGIEMDTLNLFRGVSLPTFDVSTRLYEDLEEAKFLPLLSEKAKSELIITPMLKELKRKYPNFTFFSGFALNIKGQRGLNGIPDYMLSAHKNAVDVTAPIFCLVESKNKAAEDGYAQCAAEMYAAQLFNKQSNEPHEIIYGAVTNAFDWVFMKLENNTIYIDTERYYLNELPKVLSILQWILQQYQ